MIMQTLYPINDSRKSFYGKAKTAYDESGALKLYSYDTLVAKIENKKPIVIDTYSPTTLRHIKEFLIQNGYEATTKKQIEKDYMTI